MFEGVLGHPWVRVVLADCDDQGNYTGRDEAPAQVRLIELLCSDDGPKDWYEELAIRIADYVGWSVHEDIDDRQVWP